MPREKKPITEELTNFVVNGRKYALRIEPNWTLADVLRDKLGLIGTKVACDRGTCGACTVLVGDKPMLSCTTLGVECDGKEITTIEGLAKGGKLHPIQQAAHDHSGFQCGFCTPGMIMTAKALLDDKPHPTEDEIREALAGHICRCGVFYSFIESVTIASEER